MLKSLGPWGRSSVRKIREDNKELQEKLKVLEHRLNEDGVMEEYKKSGA